MSRHWHNQKGFSVLEVLIVFSIAGLIILILFLVVPQLRRNARNHQRRADVNLLLSVLREKVTHGDKLPDSCNNHWHNDCWVIELDLGFYDNTHPSTANNVSYYHHALPWTEDEIKDNEIPTNIERINEWDETDDHGYAFNRVSIRTHAKCHPTNIGHFTSIGAKYGDIAAQFLIETGSNSWQLQCYEI